ncbi:hypothetical protein K3495_g1617 [Podosphaera aphanis]|nr:hypothetical protein K3495_g1617 [Podosphaera aphanis]
MSISLKAAELKIIAFKCGTLTTGTKATLSTRIQEALASLPPRPTRPRRILSIDVGIRNLAYCVLDAGTSRRRAPSLHAWKCLAISSAPAAGTSTLDADATPKESFDPATISSMAYTLLREQLLEIRPTHVLIERQRFRTSGKGSNFVFEWTLRVNMFEASLHAVLHTLRREGLWTGEVLSILPQKVSLLWLGEEVEAKGRSSSVKRKNKRKKIDLVRSWLEHGTTLMTLGNKKMENIAESYRKKWERTPGRPKKKLPEKTSDIELVKLDDLADSLLQGLAWLNWEENKRLAAEKGIETLLDT